MCLTIPAKVIKINKNKAKIRQGKDLREVDISLLQNIKEDDYILEQAGFAIKRVPAKEALEIIKIFKQNL